MTPKSHFVWIFQTNYRYNSKKVSYITLKCDFCLEKPDGYMLRLANWLSHQSFKLVIAGSSPVRSTTIAMVLNGFNSRSQRLATQRGWCEMARHKCSVRLVVRTLGFHPSNTGSIPVPSAKTMLGNSQKFIIFVTKHIL